MLISTLLLCAAAPVQENASLRPLEPMDLFELEGVENPTVSPDGSKVLFTRVGFDVMNDSKRSELWIHDVASGDSRPLLPGSAAPSGHRAARTSPTSPPRVTTARRSTCAGWTTGRRARPRGSP